MEGVGLQEPLGLLRRRSLVDDQGAGAVGERARRGQLPALTQVGQVLPVGGADRLDLLGVLQVFDDGCVLNVAWPAFWCWASRRKSACRPKNRPE